MPGERERAAAIKSRPTWAMNTTAGSAARAGEAAAAAHSVISAAKTQLAARHTALRHHTPQLNVLATVVMRCLSLGHLCRRRSRVHAFGNAQHRAFLRK